MPRDVGCFFGTPGIVTDAEHDQGRTDLSGSPRNSRPRPRDLAEHARHHARGAQDDPLCRGDRPCQVVDAAGRRDDGDGPATPDCEVGGQLCCASGAGVVSDGDEDLVRDVPAGRAPSREEHRDGRAGDERPAVAL
jgi:hypothetical protein